MECLHQVDSLGMGNPMEEEVKGLSSRRDEGHQKNKILYISGSQPWGHASFGVTNKLSSYEIFALLHKGKI